MKTLFALIDALHQGKELANAAAWKNSAILLSLLTGFLASIVTLAKVFGYDTGLDESGAGVIAAGLVSLYGAFTHVISSKKVGLPAKSAPADDGQPAAVSAPAQPVDRPVAQPVRPAAQSPAAHLVAQTRAGKSATAPKRDEHADWINRELDKSGG